MRALLLYMVRYICSFAALVALGSFHTLYKTSEKADIVFLRSTYIKTDLLTVRVWN